MMTSKTPKIEPIWVWGLPLAPLSLGGTVEAAESLIEEGAPSFIVTANLHYAMLMDEQPGLRPINDHAAFVVADGAPLVWAARRRIPERVAGSDLIYALCELAARRGYRVFFAGGPTGVAELAAGRLTERYPGLQVVGHAAPRFRDMSADEYDRLRSQICDARPHMLIVAATMPHGESWIDAHLRDLGVPLCVNLGASIDFAAGRIQRAPRWMQKSGLEWAFRLAMEPRRLFSRYARDARFLGRQILKERGSSPATPTPPASHASLVEAGGEPR